MHFDWANSRNDPIDKIKSIGREIERMDKDMNRIQSEIELLDNQKWDLKAFMPMTSLK
jgi:hypothetical protein